jgi:hypothetical protein
MNDNWYIEKPVLLKSYVDSAADYSSRNFDNGHHSPRQGLVERNTGIKPPSFRFHSPVQNNFYDQQDSVSVWRQKRDEYMVAIRNAKNARELGYKRNLLPQNNTVMDFNSQGGEPENEADDDSGFHKYVTRNMVQRKYSGDDEPRNTTLDDSSSMYPHQATSSNLLLNNTSRVNMLQPSASAGTNSYDIQSLQAQLNAMNLELQRRMMLEYEFAIRSLNIQIQAIQNYNSWLEFMQQVNNYKALASRPDNLHEIYEETDTTEIHGDPQATSQLPTLNEKNPPVLPHDGKIEVDTYQVAVDNGDCSIHLLVLRPTSGRRYGPRGTILRAILMDGGNSSTVSGVDASTSIRATIEDIEDLYYQQNLFNGLDEPLGHHNRLKFHTWIVTHWDADHWMGAMQLLVSEMAAYDKKQSAYLWYETDHSHKISAQKKYGHEVKYPFSMTNPTLEKRPRSVLYCPTWCWAPKPAPSNFTGGPTDATKTSGTFSAGLLRPKEMIDSLKLEFLECPNSIKVCYGPDELIGRDFWTNQKVPSPVNNIKHISQVEQALSRNSLQSLDPNFRNRPKFETWPIFFCFGAAGTVIGDATKPLPTKTEGEETPANRSSIMSLLYWPAMNGTPESISMYWSGDAVKSIETTFAKKVTSFLGNRRVGILKLSHHGSQHSTPMELLDALKPCRFIVSAGSHRKYEHPRECITAESFL